MLSKRSIAWKMAWIAGLVAWAPISAPALELSGARAELDQKIDRLPGKSAAPAKRRQALEALLQALKELSGQADRDFSAFEARHRKAGEEVLDPDSLPEELRKEGERLYDAKFELLKLEILLEPIVQAASSDRFLKDSKHRSSECERLEHGVRLQAPSEELSAKRLPESGEQALRVLRALCGSR